MVIRFLRGALKRIFLPAASSVVLLAMGCGPSGPAGVYTCVKVSAASPRPARGEPAVTLILELRANGSYISTVEGAIRGLHQSTDEDLPQGRGTWEARDGSVILSSGGREVARFLIDGLDLISFDGSRFARVRWLSNDRGAEPLPLPGDS